MANKKDEEKYFRFILKQCDDIYFKSQYYDKMLHQIHGTYYVVHNPLDKAREEDGLALREKFKDKTGIEVDWFLDNRCTILELFIGTAIRFGTSDCVAIDWLFFQILRNTGLSAFTNDMYDEYKVNQHIKILNEVTYGPTGSGGGMFHSFADGDIRESSIQEQYDIFYRDFLRPILEIAPDFFE